MPSITPSQRELVLQTLQAADNLLTLCRPIVRAMARSYAYYQSGEWICVHCCATQRLRPNDSRTLHQAMVHHAACPVPAAQAILALDAEPHSEDTP